MYDLRISAVLENQWILLAQVTGFRVHLRQARVETDDLHRAVLRDSVSKRTTHFFDVMFSNLTFAFNILLGAP